MIMSHRKRKYEKGAGVDKEREVHSSSRKEFDDGKSYESQQKRPDKYRKKEKKRHHSDIENCDDTESISQHKSESTWDKYSRKEKRYDESDIENCDGIESYKKKRKSKRKDTSCERNDKKKSKHGKSKHKKEKKYEKSPKMDFVQEKRYGKWADDDKDKEMHSSSRSESDDREIYESRNKRQKTSEKYNRKEKRHDDNDEEKYDDIESYKKRRKSNKREKSYERDERRKNKYNKEKNHESSPTTDFFEDKRSHFSSRDKRPREYVDLDNKYSKEKNHKSSPTTDSFEDKRSHFSSRDKRPREYVDLDNPNRRYDENMENETVNKSEDKEKNSKKADNEPLSKREKIVNINTRTGGAYIPPAKLRMMQESIQDKSSEAYQRLAWEALKKSIVGMTNKINSSNISEIVVELFKENIIRGRGVLARAIMQAQGASPTFTRVYAALVAIINTKFPEIGELILKRLIIQYKRGFRRNDKTVCLTAARFLAHLLNQEVAHEILILEIVTHLLENPTDDSVEVAICILKECGKKLTQLTARGMRAITQRVRDVLHEGIVDSRTRYMIEVFFAVQKDGFKDFEIIPEELDLVEEEDKFTHLINLDDAVDNQEMLNIFKFDPDYLENEEKYKAVVKEILGDSDEEDSGAESDSEAEEEEDEEKKEESQQIVDMTETNIVCLRRKIYLTIQSSLDFEECAHKLLKLELKPGQILEMCYMILDCCAQQRTYEKFYGLLAQRFCQLNKIYVEPFTEIFQNSYKTIHRLETNKLRNVAKFFAHLLFTDAISWTVLSIIKLNEDDTSSSSRIFIKILFQELCEYLGLAKLNERVKDVTLQEAFEGLFPRDLPHNTRFAINFFTSIGLGGLTDELREHLKNMQKTPMLPVVEEKASSSSSLSSSSSTSSSSSSSSSSDSE